MDADDIGGSDWACPWDEDPVEGPVELEGEDAYEWGQAWFEKNRDEIAEDVIKAEESKEREGREEGHVMTIAHNLYDIWFKHFLSSDVDGDAKVEPMKSFVSLVKGMCIDCNVAQIQHIPNETFEPILASEESESGYSLYYYEFSDFSQLVLFVDPQGKVERAWCYETPDALLA